MYTGVYLQTVMQAMIFLIQDASVVKLCCTEVPSYDYTVREEWVSEVDTHTHTRFYDST